MDLSHQTPELLQVLLGEHGEELQVQAWEALLDRYIQRTFGAWRVVGAGKLGTRSMPGNHSLEVRR